MRQKYEYRGRKYALHELAEATGVSLRLLSSRLGAGWNVEDAVNKPARRRTASRSFCCEINGEEIRNIAELSERIGVKRYTIYQRLHRGETLQEIADLPCKTALHEYNGERYSLRRLSQMTGISALTIKRRMNEGLSIEEIIQERGRKKNRKLRGRQYLYKGKKLRLMELLKLPECQVGFNTLRKRLEAYDWDVEDAVTTPSMTRRKKPQDQIKSKNLA